MPRTITRRNFLKISAVATASGAVLAGCQSPRRWVILEPYVLPPEEQLAGQPTWYASTCRQCPAGCGIVVRIMNGRALKIEGNPEHPLNQGKLCALGQTGPQLLYNPDRLPGPVKQAQRGSQQYQPIEWNEALNTLYTRLAAAGSKVAVWGDSTMSGHLYDLFNRFTTAIGAPAPVVFDLHTALDGAGVLSDVDKALWQDANLPAYDVANADMVLSFGADFASTWLSSTRYGIEYGHFRSQPMGKRGYLVQFEPRMSATGAKADQWVPLRPGTEGLVAQAIARLIADQGAGPADRVARAKALAGNVDIASVANTSEVTVADLSSLARAFATTARPMAIPGTALAGFANGVQAATAVQALNLIAGTLGQAGGMSLSPAPAQPAFSRLPNSSFGDIQNLISHMQSGQVQALLIHGANPVYSLPPAVGFLKALAQVPFVVSFAPIVDETAAWADLVLPDHTYLESWGYDVVSPGFGIPVISSQQPVVVPFTDSRATGDVLLSVARGIPATAKALPWTDEVEFLKEMVNQLGPGAAGGSSPDVLFARFQQHGGWWPAQSSTAAPPTPTTAQPVQVGATTYQGSAQDYPYYLHLYTTPLLGDGSGANLPWLQGSPDPLTTIAWQTWVELNPVTGRQIGLVNGDVVKVTSPHGEIEAPVYLYPAIRPDTIAIPLGQGHSSSGRYARDRGVNAMQLVGAEVDASGSHLAWASSRVKITPTGRHVALAVFENTVGVTQGFLNQAFPGQ